VQKVRGVKRDQVAAALRSQMGSDDTENPQYQAGEGCLADQLIGQYLAHAAALGPLLDPAHLRKTVESIYRYNFKRTMLQHDTVQRVYVLNDEPGLVVCDYAKAERPRIPFPYYAEAWTGMEYSTGALMIFAGLVREGVECFESARRRFDGERRNPWDEPECGHHYARAMSAWSGLLAFSGFRYDGPRQTVSIAPPVAPADFRCLWATATGWGVFARTESAGRTAFRLQVDHGALPAQTFELKARGTKSIATVGSATLRHAFQAGALATVRLDEAIRLTEGQELRIEVLG
jgi:non-lysosomal glucosylceramidase